MYKLAHTNRHVNHINDIISQKLAFIPVFNNLAILSVKTAVFPLPAPALTIKLWVGVSIAIF